MEAMAGLTEVAAATAAWVDGVEMTPLMSAYMPVESQVCLERVVMAASEAMVAMVARVDIPAGEEKAVALAARAARVETAARVA